MTESTKLPLKHAHSTPDPDDMPTPEPEHIPEEVPQPNPPPVQEPEPPHVPIQAFWSGSISRSLSQN